MKFIVAADERWGIGKDGDLLISIPDDMRYYIETTRGKVVVMGYNTLISLPNSKPAPGRLNIVLADIPGLRVSGAVVCGSLDQLLKLIGCFEADEVFCVGGGSVYRLLAPYCTRAHITKMRFDGGADTFIPNLDEIEQWSVEEESETLDYNGLPYSFVVYRNAKPEAIPMSGSLCGSMTGYFRKKDPVEILISESDSREYREELKQKLTAYFYPIADGFAAEDVDAFFENRDGRSFEQYMNDIGAVCRKEFFIRTADAHGRDQARSVTVTKENLHEVISSLG
jgi:dihydrofolate reductase